MKNYEIMEITAAYNLAKQQAIKGTGMILPASVAWKRRLNMKDLLAARDTITEAINESDKSGEAIDEILDQETDVKIRKIKALELENCLISEVEMDTLAFMIEE